jgi:mevalonate kinase
MLRRFPREMAGVRGARIDNHRTTLPLRKGLSSSAAVCVLVVRALAALSEPPLALTTRDTMALAYAGESLTPSGCGRMDQCVAMGRGAVALMTFAARGDDPQRDVQLHPLRCGAPLHFVVCDVAGGKDTVAILRDLRGGLREPRRLATAAIGDAAAPGAAADSRASFLRYAHDVAALAASAAQAVREGDAAALARCMRAAQRSFDAHCAPLSPQELAAPRLHALIAELQQQADVLAAKGVGSQGDGALQLLCASEAAQRRLLRHLRDERRLAAFALTVPATDASETVDGP